MSIYESIGGEPVLVEVLDGLYRRIALDADLAPFFANRDLDRIKARQAEFLGHALGGPVEYRGRPLYRQPWGEVVYDKTPSMKDVHRRGLFRIGQSHARIEQWHFARFVEHLAASLTAAGVADEITQEILTVLAPLADDIVTGEYGDGALITPV